jgi:hypothetical protein
MNAPLPYAARAAANAPAAGTRRNSKSQLLTLVLSWTAVGLPLLWGVVETLRKTVALFQ